MAQLLLTREVDSVMRRLPTHGLSRRGPGEWERSFGDVTWRLAVEGERDWPASRGRIWIGHGFPALRPIGEMFIPGDDSEIRANLLVLAGYGSDENEAAVTLVERRPRLFGRRRSDGVTWVAGAFTDEMARLLTDVAMPWWSRITSLADAVTVLTAEPTGASAPTLERLRHL